MAFMKKKAHRKQSSAISGSIDTLLGPQTTIEGNLGFTGGLHVDGVVKGNLLAEDGSPAHCHISEQGRVIGEVRVPCVNINGTVDGDVYASELVELAENARINGNVYYNLIDIAVGAQVNGQLLYCDESPSEAAPTLQPVVTQDVVDAIEADAADDDQQEPKSA